jgi:mRNA interferase HicA
MTRDELIRSLRRLARERGVAFEVDREHGKGSHWVVTLGERRQVVPQSGGGDLKPRTMASVLRGLGLTRRDLE